MITLFFGENQFGIEKNLAKELAGAEEGTDIINFNKEDLDTLPNELATDSFFTERRLFIVRNKLEKITKETDKKLANILANIANGTSIIFIETKAPKGEVAKLLKKTDAIIRLDKPREKDIANYIKESVANEDGKISPLATERLLSYVGADFYQLEEEIKKLVLYKKGDKEDETIQVADIDELVKSSFESSIFELMDAISIKNTKRAQCLMNSFLENGENTIYILTMIARQFRNIAMAKLEPNINQNSLAKKAGIHPFVAKKSISQARNFEKEEIINIYEKIQEADLKLKSGFQGSHVLEEFVLDN